MISVKHNIKDLSIYTLEATWFVLKPLIIIGIICIPFALFFLLVGIFVDKESIAYGSCVFYVLLFSILIVLRVYFHYRKVLKAYFRDANSDGNIELTISYNDNEYQIEAFSNKTVSTIKKTDIKAVKVMKKCVFIKTTTKQMIFFPRTDEVLQLFAEK